MKKMIQMAMAVLVLAVLVPAGAVELRQLSTAGMAQYEATHMVEIQWFNFTNAVTATNTAQTFVVPIAAGTQVQCVGAKLVQPFSTLTTNTYTTSMALVVGDTSGGNNYLASMEMATSNSPVYWRNGTQTIVMNTGLFTNVFGGVTNAITYVTAVTNNPPTYYATATNLYFTVTPETQESVGSLKQGIVDVYLRLR